MQWFAHGAAGYITKKRGPDGQVQPHQYHDRCTKSFEQRRLEDIWRVQEVKY
jgi:hypothetical protein